MRRGVLVFGMLVLVCAGAAARPSAAAAFSASTLERAFEHGCSLVLADIQSVRKDGGMYHYVVRIVRVIVAGDLEKEDAHRPLELFAGASYGDTLQAGSCYAIFIARDCPHQFAWSFRDDVIEIDPSDREAVRRLIELADRVYAKTSIRRFRRGRIWPNRELPPLPEALAALCQEFRNKPGRRTEIGKKIFESDLGSRIEQSIPSSSTRVYLPPKIICSRQQMVSLLGYPNWKNGRTYSWTCDHFVSAREGGKQIGVLSVVFDENDKGVRVLYGMYERSQWIRPSSLADRLAELEGNPADVARGFQEALKVSDWEMALSYCSSAVRAEARRSGSREDFFRRFVPVKEVISASFKPLSYSSREGRVMRMSKEVHLADASAKTPSPVRWAWTLVRTDQAWAVDFDLMPLDRFVEKERVKQGLVQRQSPGDRQEFDRAVRYVLTPLADEFVLGQPMLFRLEMKNVGDKTLGYWRTSVMVNDPMLVIDPNGRTLPYIDTSYQTGAGTDAILPGETIVLEDQYDVASQYRVLHPGRYKFQWKSHDRVSNICEMDVKPGPVPEAELIYGRIRATLPTGWGATRRVVAASEYDEPPQGKRLYVSLIGKSGGKGNDCGIDLLILMEGDRIDADPWLKEWYDFWGLSRWGPVYARVGEIEPLWPKYREGITGAWEITTAD